MSLEKGLITEQKSNLVLIESEANSGCESCAAKSRCISDSEGQKRKIWVENTLGAHPGDHVIFEIKEKNVLFSSFLLYLVPVLFLVTGIILGSKYSYIFRMEKDLSSALAGFCGLLISAIIIRIVSNYINRKMIFYPTLVQIEKINSH